jgi:hypothetical protein
VFDVYWSSSLKAETRSKRGIGTRRRVTDKGKIGTCYRLLQCVLNAGRFVCLLSHDGSELVLQGLLNDCRQHHLLE